MLSFLIDAAQADGNALNVLLNFIDYVLHSVFLDLLAGLIFLHITVPETIKIGELYEALVSEDDPLPAWRQGRVTDENIETVRQAILLYVLFLFYSAIKYPLTLGGVGPLATMADVVIQFGIIGELLAREANVRSSLLIRNAANPDKQKKVDDWLSGKLDGLGLEFADMKLTLAKLFLLGAVVVALRQLSLSPAVVTALEALQFALG